MLALTQPVRQQKDRRCTDEAAWRLVREARDRGFCVMPGLLLPEAWAVGVVVLDANGQPVASSKARTRRISVLSSHDRSNALLPLARSAGSCEKFQVTGRPRQRVFCAHPARKRSTMWIGARRAGGRRRATR